MNQGQRFNPINQRLFIVPYAQPYPLNQSFNYLVPQPYLVPQQSYNHPTYNDRSWIDKPVVYRHFTQNQQAPQVNNQQRASQIQTHYTNYLIPNQQTQQHYNQHQVQANYQRDQLTHAPYSLAPFVYPPIPVNQYPFNYPRGTINPPQAFNARHQSSQQSSTNDTSRKPQPHLIGSYPSVKDHQAKPSVRPADSTGVTQGKHYQPYAQSDVEDIEHFIKQGYEVVSRRKSVDKSDAKIEKKHVDTEHPKDKQADCSRSQLSSGSKDNSGTLEKKPSSNPFSKEVQTLQEQRYKKLFSLF